MRKYFDDIIKIMVMENEYVEPGKMMSCEGIKYKNKVFAFYYKEKMVFRLGKGYDISKHGIEEFEYLNPFKNKPPMKGWYEIEVKYSDKWLELAESSMEVIKKEVDK